MEHNEITSKQSLDGSATTFDEMRRSESPR